MSLVRSCEPVLFVNSDSHAHVNVSHDQWTLCIESLEVTRYAFAAASAVLLIYFAGGT
jgi:hypothetical protein